MVEGETSGIDARLACENLSLETLFHVVSVNRPETVETFAIQLAGDELANPAVADAVQEPVHALDVGHDESALRATQQIGRELEVEDQAGEPTVRLRPSLGAEAFLGAVAQNDAHVHVLLGNPVTLGSADFAGAQTGMERKTDGRVHRRVGEAEFLPRLQKPGQHVIGQRGASRRQDRQAWHTAEVGEVQADAGLLVAVIELLGE